MSFYHLSFADDDGFRGAVVLEATSELDAVLHTHKLRINPGGQVMILEVPELPENYPRDTLLSRADMERLDGQPGMTLRDLRAAGLVDESA